jgi:hypothetical protein
VHDGRGVGHGIAGMGPTFGPKMVGRLAHSSPRGALKA